MKNMFARALGCLLAVLPLAGCRTPTSGITIDSYPRTAITVNSKMVGSRLSVKEVNVVKQDDLMVAQVTVQNVTQRDLQFEYRYRWLDGAGMEVDTRTATWVPLGVTAREHQMMRGVAPTARAEDFIVDIRLRAPSTRWK